MSFMASSWLRETTESLDVFHLLRIWRSSSFFKPVDDLTIRLPAGKGNKMVAMSILNNFFVSLPPLQNGDASVKHLNLHFGYFESEDEIDSDLMVELLGNISLTKCKSLILSSFESIFYLPPSPAASPVGVQSISLPLIEDLTMKGAIFWAKNVAPCVLSMMTAVSSSIKTLRLEKTRLGTGGLDIVIPHLSVATLEDCELDDLSLFQLRRFLRQHNSLKRIVFGPKMGDGVVVREDQLQDANKLELPELSKIEGSSRQICRFISLLEDRQRRYELLNLKLDNGHPGPDHSFDSEATFAVLDYLVSSAVRVDDIQFHFPCPNLTGAFFNLRNVEHRPERYLHVKSVEVNLSSPGSAFVVDERRDMLVCHLLI